LAQVRGKRMTPWRLVLWLVVAGLVVALAGLGYRVWRIWRAARPLLQQVDTARALAADPATVDPATLAPLVVETHTGLVAVRDEARPFLALASHLGWVPGIGPDLKALPLLLDIAVDLSGAGEVALEGLAPLLDLVSAGGAAEGQDTLALAVHTLVEAQPQLEAAQALLQQAEERRARIGTAPLSPRLARLVDMLDRALPLAQAGIEAARLAPGLLGVSGPRTYLLMAQNSDELRPTGGFITGAGPVTVDNGNIKFSFRDSYFVDDFSKPYGDPPRPLYDYMGSELWVFRDANWSPDFPTSARKAAELYTYGQGLVVDGVIAFDQQTAARVIAALGPIPVEGWEEPITGDNFIRLVRQAWNPSDEGVSGEWARTRKEFLGQLAQTVLSRVREQPKAVDWAGLGRALWQALQERHLLLCLKDPAAASLLHRQGWDGALRASEGDYLMAVDANLGFNKVNPYVERRLEYQVALDTDGAARGTLTIHYQHNRPGDGTPCNQRATYAKGERVTYEGLMEGCYWNYLRVYVPEGSHLQTASPHPTPATYLLRGEDAAGEAEVLPDEVLPDKGKAAFGQFFVVERGRALATRFEYALPRVARSSEGQWHYTLLIQKQPGTDRTPVSLTIVLPPGTQLLVATPTPRVENERTLTFALKLDTDVIVEVTYR
jgi:hypothetical protein